MARTPASFTALLVVSLWLFAGTVHGQDPAGLLDGLLHLREGRSMRASSTRNVPGDPSDPKNNRDNLRVAPGKTHVLADLDGPGVITHVWMTFLGPGPHPWAPKGAANHKEMVLRMYWDGHEEPDVEAPVGDFFASGFGMRMAVRSLPVQVEGGASYNCFWPMPFRKSARMEIENDGKKEIALLYYNIDWIKKDRLPENTPYFHAQYRQEYPVQHGRDYLILDAVGRGHYVGCVLTVRSRSPGWFGEGDEKILVDGDEHPSIQGTGTEDYFLSAWGLRKQCFPFFGCPYTDGGEVLGGKTCAYRWHLADPVVFQERIRVTIEHYGWIAKDENPDRKAMSWNEREDDYASTAFWYQVGTPKRFARVPSCAERALPEIDRVFPGAAFTGPEHHGKGEAVVQKGGLWTGFSQMLYQPPAPEEAWVEIPFEVQRKRPLRLVLKLTTSYDFGIYDVFLDGVRLKAGLDLYTPETKVREFPLLDFWPEAGRHVLRLACTGKNRASRGCWIGVDSVRLRERRPRVEQYGFDQDRDWKKDPVLY